MHFGTRRGAQCPGVACCACVASAHEPSLTVSIAEAELKLPLMPFGPAPVIEFLDVKWFISQHSLRSFR